MGKPRPVSGTNPQIDAYRDLAREALDSVAIYNARAQWFDRSGNGSLANEYRRLSQEALERAQRYKELADLADENLKILRFETLGKPIDEKPRGAGVKRALEIDSKRRLKEQASGEHTSIEAAAKKRPLGK